MSVARYEQYKDALRRGHVAALRGHRVAAIDAYSEAATIAPDRALPLVSLAGVLVQLGRTAEALAAFDAALDRVPGDETALRGRADLLVASGDRAAAADALDRLAVALERAERLPDATDAARRALELAESRSRRRSVAALTDRLRLADREPAAADALARALDVLEGRAIARHDGSGPGAAGDAGTASQDARSAPGSSGPGSPASQSGPASTGGSAPGTSVPPAPPMDPAMATAAVEAAAEAGDAEATVVAALAAAAGHRAAGSVAAAIDACYLALALSPTEPRLHLTLADLYLDRGWRPLAVEKLLLLRTLAGTAGDQPTLDAIAAMVARLPDEPRLTPAAD